MSQPHKKPKLSPPSSVHNPDSSSSSSDNRNGDDDVQPTSIRRDSESQSESDTSSSMDSAAAQSSSSSKNRVDTTPGEDSAQRSSDSSMNTSPDDGTSSRSTSAATVGDSSTSADRSSTPPPITTSAIDPESDQASGSSKKENLDSPKLANVQTNGISQHDDEQRDDDLEMKCVADSPSASSSSDCSSSSSSTSYDARVVELTCKWRRKSYALKVHGSTTIGEMKLLLCQFTQVLPKRMKIVGLKQKGGELLSDSATVSNLDLQAKKRFIMIGTPEDSIWVDPSNLDPGSLPEVIDDLDYDFVPEELTEIQANPANRKKLQKRIDTINVNIINAPRRGKRLLVLDLDYTLFDMKSKAPNFEQLKRPFTDEFLEAVYPEYDIVIWSQTSWRWLELKLTGLNILTHPRYRISFVLDRTAMFPIINKKKKHEVKPLALIWAKFKGYYNESNTVHIDDVSRNFAMNPRNGLKIVPFKHAHQMRHTDRELVFLARYLVLIAQEKSFHSLDHSKWKKYLADHPGNY